MKLLRKPCSRETYQLFRWSDEPQWVHRSDAPKVRFHFFANEGEHKTDLSVDVYWDDIAQAMEILTNNGHAAAGACYYTLNLLGLQSNADALVDKAEDLAKQIEALL
jgi:hypothetical protein